MRITNMLLGVIALQLAALLYVVMRVDDNTHKSYFYLDDIYHKTEPPSGVTKYWKVEGMGGWFK